jgi:serine/threonine-protein kinase
MSERGPFAEGAVAPSSPAKEDRCRDGGPPAPAASELNAAQRMPPHTVASVAALLRDSDLLGPDQRQELSALERSEPQPHDLLRAVLRRNWLTHYQAVELFAGRGQGLRLGEYIVLDLLGEGASSRVFKARHRRTGEVVGLKVLINRPAGAVPGCLLREGWAGRRLAHPNVLRIYEPSRDGETLFLVMEHAAGKDLARLVREHGPLPVGRACDYARQAALGLQHAHERGLIHRDVKPSNLLLTSPDNVVKVLDLGLALPVGAPGAPVRVGTPDYMAPEQASEPASVDARSDVYGLGCALYVLLAGRPPFPDGTAEQKLLCHQQQGPPLVEQLRPEVSPELSAVVRRMMAKLPADRYPSLAAVAEALAPFAEPGGCEGLFVLEVGNEGLACLNPEQATVVLPEGAPEPKAPGGPESA